MATKQQSFTPLIDIQSIEFANSFSACITVISYRPDVMTLAHLDQRDAKCGYRAGREFYFVDAEPHEQGCKVYLPQRQRLEQARKGHSTAQEPLRSAI
jgi:hypothetical protein